MFNIYQFESKIKQQHDLHEAHLQDVTRKLNRKQGRAILIDCQSRRPRGNEPQVQGPSH